MPLYSFRCKSCGSAVDDFAPVGGPYPACPACGGVLAKVLSMPLVHIPEWAKAVNSTYVSNHEKWFKSDETQAKLKSGELEPVAKGDRG